MDSPSNRSRTLSEVIPDFGFHKITIRRHAFEQMYIRRISEDDIEEIILTGKVIEQYPDDYPLPSYLICGFARARMLHVVAAFNCDAGDIIVITAYEPDDDHFVSGKTRREL
ncbi:DUF4258 domain-containing protein [Methanospirillum lacunae]|uniref:DUF4258 domain-containing protein n=1 Tax=Methanospirillum lacunae TaxID=668570 RepID=A0A2V2N0U6_9EURY|nr:DUF4258 domain-containing protein [Methanospirillum lacunae]PWR73984.1 hypothetical protein DK846_02125 [Methanospirillum lacunae]